MSDHGGCFNAHEWDTEGTDGWEDAISNLVDNYQVPNQLKPGTPEMDPLTDAIYCTMKQWRNDGSTFRYSPACGG